MPTQPSQDDPVAREWQALSRKLSHARGFCFIVYFVRDQRVAIEIKRRLKDHLQRHGRALQVVATETAQALVAGSLAALSDPRPPAAGGDGQRRVFWLEAFRGTGQLEWNAARDQLLMALNERRSRLESEVDAPLVLLLPAGAQRDAATLAPDLWHVRVHSASLDTAPGASAPLQPDDAIDERRGERHGFKDASAAQLQAVAGDDEPREVTWWRQQREMAARTAEPAPESAAPQGPKTVVLWDGFNAVMASLERGRFAQAQSLVDEVLQLATAQWQGSSGDGRMRAEHDLARAYGLAGVLANRQGRFASAVVALRQAVQHMRAVVAEQGPLPSNLTSLGAQLDQLGNAFEELGQLDDASRAYEEALTHARFAAQQPGADARSRDVLAAALSKVGEAHCWRGGWDSAAAAFAESMELIRAALDAGESPSRRRELGVALFNMGRVAEHQGRLDEAASAILEALTIDRRRLADSGQTPQALDDVAFDLEALARLDGLAPERKIAAATEALELRQRQVDLYPGVEPFRHALERARQTFDNLQSTAAPQPHP